MKREQKAALIEEMTASLGDVEAIFAVDYRGISVPQAAELRARLAESDASFRVVKNRLAKLAAESAGTEGLAELLEGPTALTLVKGDPVTAAKAIATFKREHQLLEFKGGLMEGAPLEPDQFNAIARLPALEVLHGQLVGGVASPLTGLARDLGALLSGLAIGLGQVQEQGLVGGDEPEPEPEPAEEASTDSSEDVTPEASEEAEEATPEASEETGPEEGDPEPDEAPAGEAEPAETSETENESSSEDAEAPAEDSEETKNSDKEE